MPRSLLIATHNTGKIDEFNTLLTPLGFDVTSSAALGLSEPEETGDSFEANAALKAESACCESGLAALADDSGLCVPALAGAPGIYSARWAGADKNFTTAMQRIADELAAKHIALEGTPAYFVCVLALAKQGSPTLYFRGEVHGQLTTPRGDHGFGYDPMFIPLTNGVAANETFAEMPADAKHKISHRARALALFLAHLQQMN